MQLIQNVKGGSFKDTLKYANDLVGGRASVHEVSKPVPQKAPGKTPEQEKAQKIRWAEKRAQKSNPLNNLGKDYLRSRGITISPGPDVRSSVAKAPQTGKTFSALVAFARNQEGRITGGQNILLNSKTDTKAEVAVNKRSFGVIKGSFVTLQQDKSKTGFTFLAEGLETALSLKQAGIQGKIVATLGVYNFKNYTPDPSEKSVVLCADNDGHGSASFKILDQTFEKFYNDGVETYSVYPPNKGDDFNDVLQKAGPQGVQSILQEVGIPLSVDDQPTKATAFSQKTAQETFSSQKEITPQDPYSKEAVQNMDTAQIISRLRQDVLSSITCRDPEKKETLEHNIHRFVGHVREERPRALKIYQNRDADLKDRLQSICDKVDHQLEDEYMSGKDRGFSFGM